MRKAIVALRSAARYIEEHGACTRKFGGEVRFGICGVAAGEIAEPTPVIYEVLAPYVEDCARPYDEAWAYPLTKRYDGARALAAYVIALQLEEENNHGSGSRCGCRRCRWTHRCPR